MSNEETTYSVSKNSTGSTSSAQCLVADCRFNQATDFKTEEEARTHSRRTGHKTRIKATSTTTFIPYEQ